MVSCMIMRLVWILALLLTGWVAFGKFLHLHDGGWNTSSVSDRHKGKFNIIKEKNHLNFLMNNIIANIYCGLTMCQELC